MATLFIEPGSLRSELSLQQRSTAPDGMGGSVAGWSEVATLQARIEPLSDRVAFGADKTTQRITHRITMRHRSGVSAGMRLVSGARIFAISTVHDPDESGRYLVCRVIEEGP